MTDDNAYDDTFQQCILWVCVCLSVLLCIYINLSSNHRGPGPARRIDQPTVYNA